MWRLRSFTCHLGAIIYTLLTVVCDAVRFLWLCFKPAPTLAAENLFLRRQLVQYQERHVKLKRADDATHITLVWLSRFFDWPRQTSSVQRQPHRHRLPDRQRVIARPILGGLHHDYQMDNAA